MATESAAIYDESYTPGGDLSTKQYYVMRLTAADTVNVCTGTTQRPWGILQNDPNASMAAVVRHAGRSKAVVDGTVAIAVGDHLGPDANGRLVKNTTADNVIAAVAMQAATTVGAIISVYVLQPGQSFRTPA